MMYFIIYFLGIIPAYYVILYQAVRRQSKIGKLTEYNRDMCTTNALALCFFWPVAFLVRWIALGLIQSTKFTISKAENHND